MALSSFLKESRLERGNWRVAVYPRPWSFDVEIYLVHRDGDKQFNATVDKTGSLQLAELKEGADPVSPLLRLPQSAWQLVVDAITESTPPTKKESIEAELGATKYHLEDMRRIALKRYEANR